MPDPRPLPDVPCPRCGHSRLVALIGRSGTAKVRCAHRDVSVRPGEGSLGVGDLPRMAEAQKRAGDRAPSTDRQEQLDERCGWEQGLAEFLAEQSA